MYISRATNLKASKWPSRAAYPIPSALTVHVLDSAPTIAVRGDATAMRVSSSTRAPNHRDSLPVVILALPGESLATLSEQEDGPEAKLSIL
ncbi:hypothetical protein XA68_15655 [Ophiocordyceps unilateralis]|uniref:Uncharacterized protein n=1 Tax=Ophiocordyceps unilateralis TaxID=268505 RepID=A0A2A9P7Z8_OPHUN|nr:hypothetical protein XA68_15655 [Ophiocordyceps unilateralis]